MLRLSIFAIDPVKKIKLVVEMIVNKTVELLLQVLCQHLKFFSQV